MRDPNAGITRASDSIVDRRRRAQVTVVEARERIGGRVWTYEIEGGGRAAKVDMGASFICGTR
eukprot:25758-Prorocentrum_minimum.AAC.1